MCFKLRQIICILTSSAIWGCCGLRNSYGSVRAALFQCAYGLENHMHPDEQRYCGVLWAWESIRIRTNSAISWCLWLRNTLGIRTSSALTGCFGLRNSYGSVRTALFQEAYGLEISWVSVRAALLRSALGLGIRTDPCEQRYYRVLMA